MPLRKLTPFTLFTYDIENEVNEVRRLGGFWLLRLFRQKNKVEYEVYFRQSLHRPCKEKICVDTFALWERGQDFPAKTNTMCSVIFVQTKHVRLGK